MKIIHLSTITVLIAYVAFLTISHNVYASTCAVKETIYSAPEFFLLSDNVFVGNVTSITDYGNHQWQVHFNIEKIWKGIATRQTSTVMTNTLQACGYSITVGEKYLIYTNGSPSTINPIYSEMYSDAQNDIALFDDPKFQAEEKVKEDLNKKLEVAKGIVGSMMMDKSSHIPINGVGVDEVNSTLDIVIDDERATLSVEQYTQNLKIILGDIPIKVEFGHATARAQILQSVNDHGQTKSYPIIHGTNSSIVLKSPLQQFKSGIDAKDVKCRQGLSLIFKTVDISPACVKLTSIQRLVLLHWALKPINELTVEEFKDTYKAGKKIDFVMKFKGLYACGYPSSIVKNAENKTIWESPIELTLCDPDTGYGEYQWRFGELYNVILNQTGSYRLDISFSDKTLEKEFEIK